MSKQLEAYGDNVILEVNLPQEITTPGGVVIPSKVDREAQSQATVISVGPDVTGLNPGDKVIVSRVGGEVFYLDGRGFYSLKKNDIFCIIKDVN